jgi:hypothetical protein
MPSKWIGILIFPVAILTGCFSMGGAPSGGSSYTDTTSVHMPADNADRLIDVSGYRTGEPCERAVSVTEAQSARVFSDPRGNLPDLVTELTRNTEDDFLKIKNIHDWIALNIIYDARAYVTGTIPDQSVLSVLTMRTAVCEGYANLFQAMCKLAGFDCVKVNGYSRGYDAMIHTEEIVEPNHAWNAVLIGGGWYLVDVTWDSGSISADGQFIPLYDTGYLFLRPRGMIYTHFPSDPRMQCMSPPLTEEEFRDLPFLTGEYYSVFPGPPEGLKKTNVVDGSTTIELPPHSDEFVVTASIMPRLDLKKLLSGTTIRHGKINRVLVQGTPAKTVIRVHFPDPGEWHVILYAMKKESRRNARSVDRGDGTRALTGLDYINIADLFYTVSEGSDETFPQFGFRELVDYSVRTPLTNPLKKGDTVRFSFTVEGETVAFVSANYYNREENYLLRRERKELTAQDGNFTTEMIIPEDANEVSISIKKPGTSPDEHRYPTLVNYDVVD